MRTISRPRGRRGRPCPVRPHVVPVASPAARADRLGAGARRHRNTGASGRGQCALLPDEWAEPFAARSCLKALTYDPTGGIVAAPTTSLPEWIGGVRNWDYRYCWLRDATLTLLALLAAGYDEEARRGAVAPPCGRRRSGRPPGDVRRGGERRLTSSRPLARRLRGLGPVRVGNAACEQLQLDVYGEVIDAFYQARVHGLRRPTTRGRCREPARVPRQIWREPDEGIWEIARRAAPLRPFEGDGLGRVRPRRPLGRGHGRRRARRALARVRDEIHAEVCGPRLRRGARRLHAVVRLERARREPAADSARRLPAGLRPARPRHDRGGRAGARHRRARSALPHRRGRGVDGLPPGEGVFLPCSFWLRPTSSCSAATTRRMRSSSDSSRSRNDLGLLSEEYDPAAGRLLGNFPQAFTHSRSSTRRSTSPRIYRRRCTAATPQLSGARSGARAAAPPGPPPGRRPRGRAGRATRACARGR